MTCEHEIYSRYLGSETDSEGVEWIIAGCKTCEGTMRFPAQAHLAREFSAMKADYERGMTVRLVAAKYGRKSPGDVVRILQALGTKMRPTGSPRGAPGKKATASARLKMSEAKKAYWKRRSAHGGGCSMSGHLPHRAPSDTIKFATPFGSMFAHLARKNGAVVGVQISHQMKDPDAQVPVLIRAINDALRELAP